MKTYSLKGRTTEKCRRCPARIIFLYTKNQKPIPVDAETVKDGDVDFDPKKGHVTHFVTCRSRKRIVRKRKPAPPPKPVGAQQGILL